MRAKSAEESSPSERALRGGILLFMGLGIFLRVWNFWQPYLWLDEYGTWWIARAPWSELFPRGSAVACTSSFYHLFVKLSLLAFGETRFALRLPSVIAGIGVLLLAFPLGLSVLRDRLAAFYALALFAVHQPLIWYCQEARPYGVGVFFVMLSFLSYCRLLEGVNRPWRSLYMLSTIAAFYTHYLFGIIVAVQMIHLGLRKPLWRWGAWSRTFGLILPAFLLSAGHVASVFKYRRTYSFLTPEPWRNLGGILWSLFDLPRIAVIVAAVLLVNLVLRSDLRSRFKPPDWRLMALWSLAPTLSLFIVPRFFGVTLLNESKTIHADRYLVFVLPAVLLFTGWVAALARGKRPLARLPLYLYLALYASVCLGPTFASAKTFGTWPPEGYAPAGALLAASVAPGDLVLFCPGYADADFVAAPDLQAALRRDYLLWPLKAHVPASLLAQVRLIPFRVNKQTEAYLDKIRREAERFSRVWCVGSGKATKTLVERLSKGPGFISKSKHSFGVVHVFRLEFKRPPAP